ncbi:MAG: zinc-binding dehydrogenase [Flavobacteriales bacterium]|nr:zinc-binding dehydrogenase [Flavobacteriales bacterium]
MKAIVLIKDGTAGEAFEFQTLEIPRPKEGEVQIKVSHFGLNYADIMARRGLYNDRPALPCVLGYEVVGEITAVGDNVHNLAVGDSVVGFTQFGGYAEYAIAEVQGVVRIDSAIDKAAATALATQYCTAWFAACHMINLKKGDRVLIHAAAGGVGTALVQIAKWKGCEVFGTASKPEKLEYLKRLGVDHAINYATHDFVTEVERICGNARIDVAFDPIGGSNFKKSMKLLGAGGRIVPFGASEWSASKGGLIDKIKLAFGFGFLHPVPMMMNSKAVIGVNMLRIGQHKSAYLNACINEVYDHFQQGILKPSVDSIFDAADIAKAHERLEGRGSIGKVVVKW